MLMHIEATKALAKEKRKVTGLSWAKIQKLTCLVTRIITRIARIWNNRQGSIIGYVDNTNKK